MITLKLTDDIETLELELLEVPLVEENIENATEIRTLDYNVYTDFINKKRKWTHTWATMQKSDYDALQGFYARQFTLYKYPKLDINYYSVSGVSVRLYLNAKNIIDNCGTVGDVELSLRETSEL